MMIKWIVAMVPLLLAAIAVVRLVMIGNKRVVTIMRGNAGRLRQRAVVMLLILAAYGAAWMGVCYAEYRANPYFVLGLSYPGASQGLNPNGTKFAVAEFTSDEILGEVISQGGFTDLTVEDLREGFAVEPLQAGEYVSLEQPYITTEFQIGFSFKNKRTDIKPQDVLQTYAQVYYNTLVENYSLKTNVLNVDYSELDSTDYLDIVTILDSRAENVQRFMEMKSSENATFQSSETGESFSSLAKKVENFRSVALENLKAYILENGVVKNREQYIGKLNYDNQLYNVDYLKSQAAYQVYLDVINRYEREMASIVLVPTKDLNGEFYMSRTKIGVDNFSRQADAEVANSKELSLEIENREYALSQFRLNAESSETAEGVESMIDDLKAQLTSLSEAAQQTTDEYETKVMNGYMTFTTAVLKDLIVGWGIQGAILMIVFLAGMSACMLLRTEKTSKKEAKQ